MTDPRIAVLSALSSPGWHPVPEAHGMPWGEAEELLAAYDASRAAAVPSAPANGASAPSDEDFLVAVEEALESTLLPSPGVSVLERTLDAVTGALAPLVAKLRAASTPAAPSAPADRAALLRAADFFRGLRLTGTAITAADAEAELRRMADQAQQPETQADATPEDIARALDNSTPYPIELDSRLCHFMAARLLEMLTIARRPEHLLWQPEEELPSGPQPQPEDPSRMADEPTAVSQPGKEA